MAAYALGTFSSNDTSRWPGIVRDGKVLALKTILDGAPESLDQLMRGWAEWAEPIDAAARSADWSEALPEAALTAHLPFTPGNLMGAGANYRRHVIELIVDTGAGGVQHLTKEERRAYAEREMDQRAASGMPFVWTALGSAIAGPDTPLILPHDVKQPDWELELAVVIGKPARRVSRSDALSYAAGYLIANDITARELVNRPDLKNLGMDWLACKSAPGFKVLGPYVTPARFVPDPQTLQLKLSLNGQVMQNENSSDMIFDVARIIAFVSAHVQLHPGDIIMTGSPSGNGTHYDRYLRDGDVMQGEIDGLLGAQVIRCIAEA